MARSPAFGQSAGPESRKGRRRVNLWLTEGDWKILAHLAVDHGMNLEGAALDVFHVGLKLTKEGKPSCLPTFPPG